MRENRGRHNSRHLVFKNSEDRERFIMLYQDLFVPYSERSDVTIKAKRAGDYNKLNELLKGYNIGCKYVLFKEDVDGITLLINVYPEDFKQIVKDLRLEQEFYGHHRSIWRLV